MNYCKYCGGKLDSDSVFCPHCGKRLTASAQDGRQPPPPRPEHPDHSPEVETAEQRAQRYSRQMYPNTEKPDNAKGSGPAPKKPPTKYIIPAALLAFIIVAFIISNASARGAKGKVVPTPSPAVPIPSISLPPELFSSKPSVKLPDTTPEPEPEPDEPELFEKIGPNVISILTAITEDPDYISGTFEPLIGITDVNENGCAEILAVYEARIDNISEVRYDVWRADASGTERLLSDTLFLAVGGNSGKLHLMQDSDGDLFVLREETVYRDMASDTFYDFYAYSRNEEEIELNTVWEREVYYDIESGKITDEKYYMYLSDALEISAAEFNRHFDSFTTVYTLDIVSGEYDWENTLSFDWAWTIFGNIP